MFIIGLNTSLQCSGIRSRHDLLKAHDRVQLWFRKSLNLIVWSLSSLSLWQTYMCIIIFSLISGALSQNTKPHFQTGAKWPQMAVSLMYIMIISFPLKQRSIHTYLIKYLLIATCHCFGGVGQGVVISECGESILTFEKFFASLEAKEREHNNACP